MATVARVETQAFEVPQALFERGGQWPPSAELESIYQLPVQEVNVGEMLAEVRRNLPERSAQARMRAVNSPVWGELQSIRDFDIPSEHFESETGAIYLPSLDLLPDTSVFKSFYSKPGRTYTNSDGRVENRGARYYALADHELSTPEQKLAVLREDIADSLDVIHSVDRNNLNGDEYLLYLGITDVLKQNLLAVFHALTFPERKGDFTETIAYNDAKEKSWQLARAATRKHYQTLIGVEQDREDHIDMESIDSVIGYFLSTNPNVAQFKLQEIDHSLNIGLSAHETALAHPDVDTIVAMPSGGTQIAIVTQIMYELLPHLEKVPDVIVIPLSTHSGKLALSNESFSLDSLTQYISDHYESQVQGKNILVTEDNANRGKTAQMIYQALMNQNAQRVNLSLVELDPHRVMYKQMLPQDDRPADVINMTHPDFSTVIGIVPMDVVDGSDMQRRKLRAKQVTADYHRRSTI